jgi:hypothetical protein
MLLRAGSTVHPSAPGSVHLTFHRHNMSTCDSTSRWPAVLSDWPGASHYFRSRPPSRVVRAISPLKWEEGGRQRRLRRLVALGALCAFLPLA